MAPVRRATTRTFRCPPPSSATSSSCSAPTATGCRRRASTTRILRELEQPLISASLASTRGNQIKAAELLGLNRNTLRKKIRDLDIRLMRSPR